MLFQYLIFRFWKTLAQLYLKWILTGHSNFPMCFWLIWSREKTLLRRSIGRLWILRDVFFLTCILQAYPTGFIWYWQRMFTTGFPYTEKHIYLFFFFFFISFHRTTDVLSFFIYLFIHPSRRGKNNHRKFPLRSYSKHLKGESFSENQVTPCFISQKWNEIESLFASSTPIH